MTINAYAVTNLCTGLVAGDFNWSAGLEDATRTRLNDAQMNERYVNGSVASGINLIIDLGSAKNVAGVAVLNSNCAVQKADATLKIEQSDAADMSTNLVVVKAASTLNSATLKNKDHVLQCTTAGQTARRYWRLTWTWTGTVTNFAIGEIIIYAASTQLARKSAYGGAEGRGFRIAEVEHYNGSTTSYLQGGPIRRLRLPYADLTAAQIEELYAMLAAVGGGVTPFLWIPSYEANATAAAVAEQEVIYGKIGPADFEFSEPDYLNFTPNDLVIKSLGREVGS